MAADMLERSLEIEIVFVVLRFRRVAFGFNSLGGKYCRVVKLTSNGISALFVLCDALCYNIPENAKGIRCSAAKW